MRIPSAVYIGEQVAMHVEVTAEKETKVEFIHVRVRGRQGWLISSGKTSTGFSREVPSLEKRVMEAGVLPAGTRTFPLAFTLPAGTAPTHALAPAFSELRVDVHVSIPWWPDGRYRFSAPVRMPPPPSVPPTPVLTRHPYNAGPRQPRIELSLASTTLAAGHSVVGSCAVFHMADDKPREVEVAFEPVLHLFGHRRPFSRASTALVTRVTIPAGKSGEAVPFRIGLPPDMTPSFKAVTHQLDWFLSVNTGGFFSGKVALTIPVTVLDARARETLGDLTLAPRLADERMTALFQRFAAASGWRELADDGDDQPAIARDAGDATLRIGYAYRGEAGTYLVGRVCYPSLGLGLTVTPSTSLKQLFTSDLQIDIAAWDRAHHVVARDAAQAVPFVRGAVPGVGVGTLVRWTDDELVTERASGTVEERDLALLAESLEALAASILQARAIIRPPSGLEVDLDAWHALAAKFRGALVVGDLSIDGTIDGQPVEVGLAFDDRGKPVATEIAVGSPHADGSELPERVRALVASIATTYPGVSVRDGVASVSLPVADGGTDPTRVRDAARAMRSIVAALLDSGGPYR